MNPQQLGARWTVVPMVVLGLLLAALLTATATRRMPTSSSDALDIEAVITSALETMTEACLESSHGDESTYQTLLANYFTAATPDPTEVAEQSAVYAEYYPTVDPTLMAEFEQEVATAIAAQDENYPPEIGTELAGGYHRATPLWHPGQTVLDYYSAQIDACQLRYGMEGRQSTDAETLVTVETIDVDGDEAYARVKFWTRATYTAVGGGTPSTREGEVVAEFTLNREAGGWRIAASGFSLEP